MAYKTVFTALTRFDENVRALAAAAKYARAKGAHLDVLCLGLDTTPNTYHELGANAVIMHAGIEEAHEKAKEIHKGVRSYLIDSDIEWDAMSSVVTSASAGRTVAMQARFCDLAIVGQPYGPQQAPADSLILEGLLFEADCPTLVVPQQSVTARPDRVVIGWNESIEAIRAVRAALPILQAAQNVHIAIVDPPRTGPERSDPGGALAVFLARHGIKSDIQVLSRAKQKVSEVLADHIAQTDSELLVMGAYGHSRFREAVLGGATRDMLEHSEVPVLMAH